MATANFDRQIRKTIEAFVEELSALVRAAAVQSVTEAFGAGGVPARRGRGAAAAPAGASRGRAKGQKRAPEALVELTESLLAAIKSGPGQRMEEIAKGLGTSTSELTLPAKKLLADKKIKTKGERRATKYFPA
ncbi:MAG TPA: DNA-binding protein [Polyangiaceae bacterium]|nr:DNA-binding protein [Polyangiaceae bacterium]